MSGPLNCHVNQATRFVNDRLICDSDNCEKVAEETPPEAKTGRD